MKVGMTSSRYGLYKLGYTFATMKMSILWPPYTRCLEWNVFLSTNRFLQFETREDGIASNRKSAKLRWTGSGVLYKPPVTVRKRACPKRSEQLLHFGVPGNVCALCLMQRNSTSVGS